MTNPSSSLADQQGLGYVLTKENIFFILGTLLHLIAHLNKHRTIANVQGFIKYSLETHGDILINVMLRSTLVLQINCVAYRSKHKLWLCQKYTTINYHIFSIYSLYMASKIVVCHFLGVIHSYITTHWIFRHCNTLCNTESCYAIESRNYQT